jgi:hypothetical protein
VITTVFPSVNVTILLIALFGLLAAGCIAFGAVSYVGRPVAPPAAERRARRETWQMPPLALLGKPPWSRTRSLVMYLMYGYLALAVILLVVKAVQLGGH